MHNNMQLAFANTIEGIVMGANYLDATMAGLGRGASFEECVAVVHTAIETGVNFLDTAEAYGPFSNEELLGEALAPIRVIHDCGRDD